ncbi:hypothetical protein CBX96_09970 [Shewanella sp. BC20]|uniref:Tad domain-containing protein n=1 Tax=Shewanella sp. BC20 TaxID=2004459 RepID=UPI000D64585D|nr:Tad domain-containing protein [Shewanella sp. BC20]PWF63453.1 hypothetical protein CBX96_09970 [Shewanella sp. BC20]
MLIQQKGQAMVLSLILMSFAIMVVLFSFNSAQLNLKSTKLQNTADNTAYSVATIAARDFNYKAYTNRAAVANQVAIAQLVGLSSWFNMTEQFSETACDYFCSVPYIGQAIAAVDKVIKAVNTGVQPFIKFMVNTEDIILNVLSQSQQIIHYAGLVSTMSTASDIVKANDPKAQLDLMQNPQMLGDIKDLWVGFQERHARNNQSNRTQYNDFINVTLDSRDSFSRKRTYELNGLWTKNLLFVKWNTQKAGGSDLISNGKNKAETWTAMDTIATHMRTRGCGLFGRKWCRPTEMPLGWASTRSNRQTSISKSGDNKSWGYSRDRNRTSSGYAEEDEETNGGYSGIQPFFGLSNSAKERDQTSNIAIVVSKPQKDVGTTSSVKAGEQNTNPALNEKMLGKRLNALSTAQVYYSRPRDLMLTSSSWSRSDNRHEYGNLYNPFWQTRLTDSTSTERSVVLALTRAL